MNNKNRKLIYFIEGVLCGALLVFIIISINKNNFGNSIDFSIKNQTLEQCKEKINKMNTDKLTEYVLNDSSMTSGSLEYYNRELFSRYLSCQYEQSNNESEKEEILKNAALIIERDLERKGKNPEFISIIKENFKNPNGSFYRMIFMKDFNNFCPDKLPEMCLRENGVYLMESSEWCENVCSIFNSYKNDDNFFDQEVTKFSNLDSNLKNDITAYIWRIALTVRLKGKDNAYELCRNMPSNVEPICRGIINRLEIWDADCEDIIKKLDDNLCNS